MPTMAMNLEAREALSTLILAITKTGDLYLDPDQVKVRCSTSLFKRKCERVGTASIDNCLILGCFLFPFSFLPISKSNPSAKSRMSTFALPTTFS